jgi:hypothetical protein
LGRRAGRPSFNAPNIVVAEADDAPCFQTIDFKRSRAVYKSLYAPFVSSHFRRPHRDASISVTCLGITAVLLLHFESFDESREMLGDRTPEGVVLVLHASPNCRQRNPSRMLVAFRGKRSVTVQMNAAVDETGCAFGFPCHGLPPGAKSMSLCWNVRMKRKEHL